MTIRGLGVNLNHRDCTNVGKRALHFVLTQKMTSTQIVVVYSFVYVIYLSCI